MAAPWWLMGLIGFAIILGVGGELAARWERSSRLRRRRVVTFDEWFTMHYGGSAVCRECVQQLTASLAADLAVHPTQILPADRIDGELALSDKLTLLPDEFLEFESAVVELAGRTGSAAIRNLGNLRTVNDYIQSLCHSP